MSNEKPMSTKVRDMVLRIMERAMYYNNAPNGAAGSALLIFANRST